MTRIILIQLCWVRGWRLINKPETLCAKVLKGWYFHDIGFLSASRKKHASQTWRAILAGRDVLEKGLLKRVGDGTSIRLWHDRWIPNHFRGRPLVVPDTPQVSLVSDLLTPSGGWNADLIKQVFVEIDAHAFGHRSKEHEKMFGPGSQRYMDFILLSQDTGNCLMSVVAQEVELRLPVQVIKHGNASGAFVSPQRSGCFGGEW